MRTIIDIIRQICNESEEGLAARNAILIEAEARHMDSKKVEQILDRMVRDGRIYEPSHGKYRITSD